MKRSFNVGWCLYWVWVMGVGVVGWGWHVVEVGLAWGWKDPIVLFAACCLVGCILFQMVYWSEWYILYGMVHSVWNAIYCMVWYILCGMVYSGRNCIFCVAWYMV